MATIKNKRHLYRNANMTDGSDLSKCTDVYEVKIKDSDNDVIKYEVAIPANTEESAIDAAIIAAANPF